MALVVASRYLIVPPNWKYNPKLRMIHKTGILKALTGTEQRTRFYSWGRLGISYRVTCMDYRQSSEMIGILSNVSKTVCGVPIWCDGAILTAASNVGSQVVTVESSAYRHFADGGRAIIVNLDNCHIYDIVTISSHDNTTINFTTSLVNSYTAGSMIYPLIDMYVEYDAKANVVIPSIIEIEINAQEMLLEDES